MPAWEYYPIAKCYQNHSHTKFKTSNQIPGQCKPFMFLFLFLFSRKRGFSTHWFTPQIFPTAGTWPGQNWEPGTHKMIVKDQSIWVIFSNFPRHVGRKLDWKLTGWDSNWHFSVGCWCKMPTAQVATLPIAAQLHMLFIIVYFETQNEVKRRYFSMSS